MLPGKKSSNNDTFSSLNCNLKYSDQTSDINSTSKELLYVQAGYSDWLGLVPKHAKREGSLLFWQSGHDKR